MSEKPNTTCQVRDGRCITCGETLEWLRFRGWKHEVLR